MFKSYAAVFAAAALLAPSLSIAQDDARLDLARRYVAAVKLETQLEAVTDSMEAPSARGLISQLELRLGSSDALAIHVLMDEVGDETARVLRPQFLEAMAQHYARAYTKEELEGLVAFYTSDIGRAIVAKSPNQAPAPAGAMPSFMAEVDREFERQLCRRIGCEVSKDAL